jgi:DNA-binding NarL/FixJ family response regulator
VLWRILIVDDHAIVRRMLKVLVETHPGWEVCAEAENGEEALAKIKEHKPDLVIMDMAMPVKDGLTASREISVAMPDIPIVMHTLHYSPELELEAKKSGVRKVVPKAEAGDGLLNAVAELLEGSSARPLKRAKAVGTSGDISTPNAQEESETAENGENRTKKV